MDEDEIVQAQVEDIQALAGELRALDVAGLAPAEAAEVKHIAMQGVELLREIADTPPSWQDRLMALQGEALQTAGAALRRAKTAEGRAYTAALMAAQAALERASRYGEAASHTPAPLEAVKSFMSFAKEAEDDEQTVALYGARDQLRLVDRFADDDDPEAA